MRNFLVAVALLLAFGTAHAAQPRVTGIYSSLRFGAEDLIGMEVAVVFGGNTHYVVVQCAEGEPGVPEVAEANFEGTNLSFQLSASTHSGCPSTKFQGTISSKGLTGTFQDSDWPGFLKRGPSYWQ